jgi:hypothetical protein
LTCTSGPWRTWFASDIAAELRGFEARFGVASDRLLDAFRVDGKLRETDDFFAWSSLYAAWQAQRSLDTIVELPKLTDRRQRVRNLFLQRGVDRFDTENDVEACVTALEDERLRAAFEVALKQFLTSLDIVMPRPESLPFNRDAKFLRHGAGKGSPPVPRRGRVRRLPVRREGARAHRRSCPRARCRSEDPTGVDHGSRLPLQGLRTRQRSREGIGDGAREVVERIAALDIGKAELVCCVRVPNVQAAGQRLQEVATYSTMTRSLLGMADRLRQVGVTRVVMEATSDYVRCEGA